MSPLKWPSSTGATAPCRDKNLSSSLARKPKTHFCGLAWCAFWVRHLDVAKHTTVVHQALAEDGMVKVFLYTRFLEWLECLSLLDQLPQAVAALELLAALLDGKAPVSPSILLSRTRH